MRNLTKAFKFSALQLKFGSNFSSQAKVNKKKPQFHGHYFWAKEKPNQTKKVL